jgi:nitrogen fixation protein NifU and related proteins
VDFDELYQDVILDHSRRPRNFGELPDATCHVHGNNPMCGDEVTVHVKFDESDAVEAIQFTGHGCSICMASASLMTLKIRRKSREEAAALLQRFLEMLTSEEDAPGSSKGLGDLGLLKGVRKFPLRVKCATLAWHALKEALEKHVDADFTVDPEPPETGLSLE